MLQDKVDLGGRPIRALTVIDRAKTTNGQV